MARRKGKRWSDQQSFCCYEMKHHLEDDKLHFSYDPVFREYFIDDKHSRMISQGIWFCPWCGTKLPEGVRDKWFELAEEVSGKGEDFDLPTDKELLPAEMFTDEWWIKRGL